VTKAKRRPNYYPKCPECKRRVGILFFPNTETAYVFCCGCNYRMESPEMAAYLEKTLFRGLHQSSEPSKGAK